MRSSVWLEASTGASYLQTEIQAKDYYIQSESCTSSFYRLTLLCCVKHVDLFTNTRCVLLCTEPSALSEARIQRQQQQLLLLLLLLLQVTVKEHTC
jgi:hypothetical protein